MSIIAIIITIMITSLFWIAYLKFRMGILEKEIANFLAKVIVEIERAVQHGKTIGTVQEKLRLFEQLNNKQIALIQKMDGPNKNAAHARWKRTVYKDVVSLEEEKIALIEDVVNTGGDYSITMKNPDGTNTNLSLKQLLSTMKENLINHGNNMKLNDQEITNKKPKNHLTIVKNNQNTQEGDEE